MMTANPAHGLIPMHLVVLGTATVLATPASAQGWEHETTEDGVTIESRDEAGSELKTYRARATLPFSVDRVLAALDDIDSYTSYMPYVEESKKLGRSDAEDGSFVTIMYQRLDLPVIDDRDMVLRAVTKPIDTKLGRGWVTSFRALKNIDAKSDAIRLETVSGGWRLEPCGVEGTATCLTFARHLELKGDFPSSMAGPALRGALLDSILALRQRLASGGTD